VRQTVAVTDAPAPEPGPETPIGIDPPAHPHRAMWLTILVAVVVIIVDQLTKWWAVTALADGRAHPFIGDFIRFWLVTNPGAAFSIGTGSTWVFAIVAAAAVVAISWYAWRVRSTAWALTLGLVLGGAATHLGDRLFRPPAFGQGNVVDFIDYGGFFIGNVADIAIVVGAILIGVLTVAGVRPRPVPAETPTATAATTTDTTTTDATIADTTPTNTTATDATATAATATDATATDAVASPPRDPGTDTTPAP
jgi:signal peptidase II